MAMSRKWWEPVAQDVLHDGERPARHSFDLGDLISLGMNGGEFTPQVTLAVARLLESPAAHDAPLRVTRCGGTRQEVNG